MAVANIVVRKICTYLSGFDNYSLMESIRRNLRLIIFIIGRWYKAPKDTEILFSADKYILLWDLGNVMTFVKVLFTHNAKSKIKIKNFLSFRTQRWINIFTWIIWSHVYLVQIFDISKRKKESYLLNHRVFLKNWFLHKYW